MYPHDNVLSSVCKMVQYVREHHNEDIELELRIGQFTVNGEFFPGYQYQNRSVISRLIQRMEKNCESMGEWENNKQYMFIRAEYPNSVRQTCVPNSPKVFTLKKRLGKVDISTDRIYDVRFSLCKETPIRLASNHAIHEMVKRDKPLSVRMIQRASFIETIKMGSSSFKVQYDISKVSRQSNSKMTCTQHPCTYHCEIELIDSLTPMSDKLEEKRQNEFIAMSLISRGRALLGTHTITENGLMSLPQPKLFVLNNDI